MPAINDKKSPYKDLPPPPTIYRVCLRCDRCFPSSGPDHRICDVHKWRGIHYGSTVADGYEHLP